MRVGLVLSSVFSILALAMICAVAIWPNRSNACRQTQRKVVNWGYTDHRRLVFSAGSRDDVVRGISGMVTGTLCSSVNKIRFLFFDRFEQ